MKKLLVLFLLFSLFNLHNCAEDKFNEAPSFGGITKSESDSTSITLYWNEARDDLTPPQEIIYLLYMGKNSPEEIDYNNPETILKGVTSYRVQDLDPNTTYFFALKAKDSAGKVQNNPKEYFAITASWKNYSSRRSYNINTLLFIEKENQKDLWIGSNEGIIIWDQLNNAYRDFNVDNSDLSDNRINKLFKDTQDNIWTATSGGVSKYNGTKWISYTTADTGGLLHNKVNTLIEDKTGLLWFGTVEGLNSFDDGVSEWRSFTKKASPYLPENNVTSLALEGGNLWVGSSREGVGLFDGKDWLIPCKYPGGAVGPQLSSRINFIAIDEEDRVSAEDTDLGIKTPDGQDITLTSGESIKGNQKVWFATAEAGAILYFGKGSQIKCGENDYNYWKSFLPPAPDSKDKGILSDKVYIIYPEKMEGEFSYWFGTAGGISKYWFGLIEETAADKTWNWTNYTLKNAGLADETIRSITKDQAGNFWFGTDVGGISSFNPAEDSWAVYSIEGPLDNNIKNIAFETKDGNITYIWLGTGKGLTRFDPNKNSWINYLPGNGLADREVRAIALDNSKNKWMGTKNGLNKFDGDKLWNTYTTKDGLPENKINTLAIDLSEQVWIGTDSGAAVYNQGKDSWQRFDTSNTDNGLADNQINVIKIDPQDKKLFGTKTGVSILDKDNTWITYLEGQEIFAIEIDPQGNYWFGTKTGVCQFDGIKCTTYNFGKENIVQAIALDNSGNKWLGTPQGLFALIGRTVAPYTSETTPELKDNYIYTLAVDPQGNIWIGTKGGLTRFGG